MAVDYDVVIIGNTPAGRQAAMRAARLKARVAWVTQGSVDSGLWVRHSALVEAVHQFGGSGWRSPSSILPSSISPAMGPITPLPLSSSTRHADWAGIQQWMAAVVANLEAAHSPSVLASLGVDVIAAQGEFCRKPTQGFTVNGRFLSARAYLLALEPRPSIPEIGGLSNVDYLTVDQVCFQMARLAQARSMVVLGEGIVAVELAQALSRLGLQITLLTSAPHLLPGADPEVVRLIQVQLETEGIQVMLRAGITQVERREGKTWVQVGAEAIAVDEIILATRFVSNVEALNLQAVGVKWSEQGIGHNAKLQTSHPGIYGCEGWMGSNWSAQVANYEAAIALKNALFFPWWKATYQGLPLIVNTEPGLAWVGLTEPEALQRYGKNIQILRRSLNKLPKAQMRSDLTGLCKLIVHRNGRLLGAHLVGNQASEWIGAIALAMQQRIPIQTLADLVLPFPTLAEIIVQTAQDWHYQRLQQNRWVQDGWDVFFDWRRS